MTKVAICVCTFNRPAGLRTLLEALQRQQVMPGSRLVVIVVDNSAEASARSICQEHPLRSDGDLVYVHEPRRGLASARNAALAAARSAAATHVAFIDDDEVPEPRWIEHLMQALDQPGVAAAVGPVHPIFADPPPAWLPVAAYTTRTRVIDGAAQEGYTCNSLIAMAAIVAHDLRFDMRFNETGGEDTLFFARLRQLGFTIAWADAAIVHEFVPRQRMSVAWLWRRWYRTGTTEAHLGASDAAAVSGKLRNLAKGGARLLGGSVRIAAAVVLYAWRRPERVVASFYTACRGAGLIANVLGRDYREYSRPGYR